MPVPGRTIHDHNAEYVAILALAGDDLAEIADELYTLMKPELGEIEEPVPPGTVGSSTMPQKRNPKLAQDIRAAAAQVQALLPLALDAMRTEHEADGSTSQMIERALFGSVELVGDILARLEAIFADLRVFPERMRENLDLSGGLIMSERVMLALGERVGRQRAHDIVYEHAQQSAIDGTSFRELLVGDAEVGEHLSAAELDDLLDPAAYTGACAAMAREQAGAGREVASGIAANHLGLRARERSVAMLKAIFPLNRRPETDLHAFREFWRAVHAPHVVNAMRPERYCITYFDSPATLGRRRGVARPRL